MLLSVVADGASNVPDLSAIILSIAGGAVGAAVIGAIGALIASAFQNSREHKRWLREKRYDAYMRLLRLADTTTSAAKELANGATPSGDRLTHMRSELLVISAQFMTIVADVNVLGNPEAENRANALVNAITEYRTDPAKENEATTARARELFVTAIRGDIGIPRTERLNRRVVRRYLRFRLASLQKKLDRKMAQEQNRRESGTAS